ncbi:hypothetical protein H7E67_10310 [Clostridium gasigenes]|uniref:hypothetical protein n=1 Tax=Clostridium gasigenes TaxID=94869 RepID=UPI001624785A|nr:hypothetical protein [Clostridium gasigenes]MBB6623819.1 hypothetical protein [Clostridium gasigenes]
MKTICNDCTKEFEMTQDKLREKSLGAMITEIYYHCPNCNNKYSVCIMNAKCRSLKRTMQFEIKKKFAITNDIESILQDEKIDNIQKELHKEMNRINGKA